MACVLVVDDIEFNHILCKKYLTKMGCRVITASNGKEAIERVIASTSPSKRIDIIFMDLFMPQMDGIDATRIIRNTHPDLPIIGLTMIDCPVDHEECHQAGMNNIIVKPIKQGKLIKALRKYQLLEPGKKIKKVKVNLPPLSSDDKKLLITEGYVINSR